MVPARFCSLRLINDFSYLLGNQYAEIKCRTQPRENKVSFVQLSSSDCASKLEEYWRVALEALQNKDIGDEMYIDYGFGYIFSNYEISTLRQLHHPRYHFLLVIPHTFCVLRIE